MTSPYPTRRTLLKHAGLLGVASTSLSGCTESLPPLGRRVRYGRVNTPDVNPNPTYREWLPAASALPTDVLNPGYVNYVQPSTVTANSYSPVRLNYAILRSDSPSMVRPSEYTTPESSDISTMTA